MVNPETTPGLSSPIPSVPGIPAGPAPEPKELPADAHWLPPARYANVPQRHPWEIPMLVVVIVFTLVAYLAVIVNVMLSNLSATFLSLLLLPALLAIGRGMTYARPRVNGVQITPTQFGEAYAMVADAAARFGLEYIPDAYVVNGNGVINAGASGHGFRRFVIINSDLFEIGGQARDPEALRFIIGHEVGHIAAGHTSYWRQLSTAFGMPIPILGSALSRAQEFTADNYGYYTQPSGAPGAMGVLAIGKYMLRAVDFDQFADRATQERGPFVHLVNALASHPVLTWRAAALRDRTKSGAMWLRPSAVVRGAGSGNAVPIAPQPLHPAAVPDGYLPNGMVSQTRP
ncbi:putative peptidase M48 family protein [Gordonia araii NBRC 100433]|uniref:Putative peptidase M48 family protein n=1 Tax=Gordonia araii NBRC 100433 TaxID=1073574 RepID=G7H155_9ACTN|nr:M48 family metallopeptidase [Gordonia araii]NNG96698.1 M48 family metallopeptidase [Gordonia araii NBRC 100433]GAB09616.1 putative peptidase M48 family protein [Gordonia araii NBRC 100433]